MDIFDDRVCSLGEGPYYDDRTGRAGWVDVRGHRVLWRDMATDEIGEIGLPDEISAVVPRANGGFVFLLPEGPTLLDPDGTMHVLDPYDDPDAGTLLRCNDAKADPAGRLWFGTVERKISSPRAALYRLLPGSTTPQRMLSDITVSNGLGWSGTRMYYVDTPTDQIDVFDYDPGTGDIDNRRPFVTLPHPDGLCVDAEGGIWVALFGGSAVRRYTPDGELDREIAVPARQTTSCAFVGPAFDTMIITTAAMGDQKDQPGAGLTYRYVPGDVAGAAAHRFLG
jgi:sugar lactone lactonase YvrE